MIDFSLVKKFIPDFFSGFLLTVEFLVLSITLGFILAMTLALMKMSSVRIIHYSARVFIYFFRGTPLLIQIYLLYYGTGQFTWIKENAFLWYFLKSPFFCALLALVFNNGAYASEIIHHAMMTTEKGEVEAAKAYGMSYFQSLVYIIIPSALRRSIPAYTNEVIFMLHATSLVSVITLLDITGIARKLYSRFYAPFEAFLTAAFFYLILSAFINLISARLEKRFNRHLG